MEQNCLVQWWQKRSEKEKKNLFPRLLAMVRGEEPFKADAKPMYLSVSVLLFCVSFVVPQSREKKSLDRKDNTQGFMLKLVS
jgi:hypothetical protein